MCGPCVLFVIVIVQNSLRVEIIGAETGDTATVFINLLILLSYSANFFIYCAMSAQFRAALFATFSRRRVSLNATAAEGISKAVVGDDGTRVGRHSAAAPRTLMPANPTSARQ